MTDPDRQVTLVQRATSPRTPVDSDERGEHRDPRQEQGSRGRPRWIPAVILVLVLGLLGAVVGVSDHLARQYAEDQIAERVRAELALESAPQVEIAGAFFLPQLLSQRIGEVRLRTDFADLAVQESSFELHEVDLTLREVTSDDWFDHVSVGELEGVGRLTWDGVSGVVGERLEFGGVDEQGRGRVKLDQTIGFEGLRLDITLSGRPEIDPATGQLQLREPQVAVSGITLPADLVADLVSSRLQPIDLPLPDGFSVTEVGAREDGLVVRLRGTGVGL